MDRLLSVSQAARMVGIPRRLLQQHIQAGQVSTFEGYIRMSELHKAYPDADSDCSGMVEKVRLIREAAAFKDTSERKNDPERLAAELHRVRIDNACLQQQLDSYKQLAAETEERLLDLQTQCDKRQASLLGSVIGWYMNQVKLRS
jgi:hypothetical protein